MGSVITCVTEFHRGPKTARPSTSTPPFSAGEHILLIIPHSSVSVASLEKARRDRVDVGKFFSEGETSPHRDRGSVFGRNGRRLAATFRYVETRSLEWLYMQVDNVVFCRRGPHNPRRHQPPRIQERKTKRRKFDPRARA